MQIAIEKKAAKYILEKTGTVLVSYQFEPSLGGCACSGSRLTGTYIPMISIGQPTVEDADHYQSQLVDLIQVYFPQGLSLKYGQPELRISLRGMPGFHWLEVDGAQGIARVIDK